MSNTHRRRIVSSLSAMVVALGAGGLLAGGCDHDAPPFPEGQGQLKSQGAPYPAGPYGVTKGATISDFGFLGFPAPKEASDPAAPVTIQLSDFYNPTGTDLYPEGSPYGAGEPKPKALLVDIGALWCSPCQNEAKNILPGEYAHYHPLGAEFFVILAEGGTTGVPATPTNLQKWVTTYDTPFPAGIDAERKLGSSFSATSYPVNMLIDTSDMTIIEVVAGVPQESDPFFHELDGLVAQ